jgi:hypothetical protein
MTWLGLAASAASKKHRSTPVAWRDQTLKFTPPSTSVAPSGQLLPGVTDVPVTDMTGL